MNTSPDSQMRARVQRLLSGDFRNEDLTRLFLFARDRCDGRESVQEIGDFVAHHDERTKGIVTRATRDWFITVQFYLDFAQKGLNPDRVPHNFPQILEASLRGERLVFEVEGRRMKRGEAQQRLKNIVKYFAPNDDGTLSRQPGMDFLDAQLIIHLVGRINANPAFDDQKLYGDFTGTLRSNSILRKDELAAFERYRPVLSLFAISVMHNCAIRIDDNRTSVLHVTQFAGKLAVAAPVPSPHNEDVRVGTSMFRTNLDVAQHCEPELQNFDAVVEHDIEVNPNTLRLAPLK